MIGSFAGPRDPGTASIKLLHHQGDLLGLGSVWGYVRGGMGRISFAIAEAAREAGATLAAGVEVARIVPGEGVEIESGELIRAPVVVCNADPKRLLGMLEGCDAMPAAYRERLEAWDVSSPVVKLNLALERIPTFPAAAGYRDRAAAGDGRDHAGAGRGPGGGRGVRGGVSRRSGSPTSTSRAPTTTPWPRRGLM